MNYICFGKKIITFLISLYLLINFQLAVNAQGLITVDGDTVTFSGYTSGSGIATAIAADSFLSVASNRLTIAKVIIDDVSFTNLTGLGLTSYGGGTNFFPNMTELDMEGTEITTTPTGFLRDNTVIEKVHLPVTLTSFGGRGFQGCTSLTSINTTELCIDLSGLINLSSDQLFYLFAGCYSITEVKFPNVNLNNMYYSFVSCTSLETVTLPNNITAIGTGMFQGCTALTGISLPDTVTQIGACAFYGDTFNHIDLPDAVTSIGAKAFNLMSNLEISYHGTANATFFNTLLSNDSTTGAISGGSYSSLDLSYSNLTTAAIELLDAYKDNISSLDVRGCENIITYNYGRVGL